MATILTIQFQAVTPVTGPTTGYTSGGYTFTSEINSFPFSTPFTTATDVGDLSQTRSHLAGQSSSTDGFASGGFFSPPSTYLDTIDSFPFSTPFVTATDVGNLNTAGRYVSGQSSSTDGYASGGSDPATPINRTAEISKFPFSTPFTTSSATGDLTEGKDQAAGISSTTDGYAAGGFVNPPAPVFRVNTIERFPFSNPFTTATDVGNLIQGLVLAAGNDSDTEGYVSGGFLGPPAPTGRQNRIQRFPFSSSFTTATDTGDLTESKFSVSGQSSETDGYVSGGSTLSGRTARIESFPFSSPFATATDTGDLTTIRDRTAGHQG